MILEKTLIIIGAGASGLIAARELADDINITILEAANAPGGRIRTIPISSGQGVIECGAEFVHGNLPITNKLIGEAGLTKVAVSGKMYRSENGKLHRETEMVEGWEELIARMKHQPDDMTMQTFLDVYYSAEQHKEIREHVRSYVHGFDLAPLHDVTVSSLYAEWSAEDEQFFLKDGYSSIIQHLCAQLTQTNGLLQLNATASIIRWRPGRVEVETSLGQTFRGTHALVTVPVSILANINLLQFIPSIPEYRKAAEEIGFGPVIKTVIHFQDKFWKNDLSFVFSRAAIPTWWSHFPISDNLLVGWAGGPDAAAIYHFSDDEILELAYESLSEIFAITTSELRTNTLTAHVFNWRKNKETLGAYSYTTPRTRQARKTLQQPLDDTLFFAGEGLVGGQHPGTVEAALSSGLTAANQIRKTLR